MNGAGFLGARNPALERVFPIRPGEIVRVPGPRRAPRRRPHVSRAVVAWLAIAAAAAGLSFLGTTPAVEVAIGLGIVEAFVVSATIHRRLRAPRLVAIAFAALAVGLACDGALSADAGRLAPDLALALLSAGVVALAARTVAIRSRLVVPSAGPETFRHLVDGLGEVIALVDGDLQIRYISPAVRQNFGHAANDLEGSALEQLVGSATGPLFEALRRAALRPGQQATVAWELVDGDGRRRFVESSIVSRLDDPVLCAYVLTIHDAHDRATLERQLRSHAFEDPLTGLANRALLRDRAERAIARAHDRGGLLGLVLVDLDGFRRANEALGRPAGDYLLSVVAQRIADLAAPHQTVSRCGGDEFAVLLEELETAADVEVLAEALLETLHAPISFGGDDYVLSASVGTTMSPAEISIDSLFEEADVALFAAKHAGGDRIRHYSASMRPASIGRIDLEGALRLGLERDEFELHYQPTYDVASGRISSFEALLRWRRPGHGIVSPDEFVTIADERGLMVEIGRFVLRRALEHVCEFAEHAHDGSLSVSVNLSATQLVDPGLVDDVRVALGASGLAAHRLILEFAESALAQRPSEVIDQLNRLRAVGVRLAIDNFGAGHATLAALQQLPIDMVKIDRSFVRQGSSEPGRSVLEAIVRLAQTLSLTTVGEGAEERRQLEVLVDLGCDMVQGYLLGRPINAEEAAVLAGRREEDEATVSPFLGSWLQRRAARDVERSLS